MRSGNSNFRGIFVQADNPTFLEKQIQPAKDFLAIDQLNVSQIREQYLARQRNYDTTPFDPDGKALRLFPGGYTVWSGYPGTGKTTLLRQLACSFLHRGKGVFVASLEEYSVDVFYRHAAVACGTEDPSEGDLDWCVFHWAQRLRLWASDEMPAPHAKLLAAIRVLAAQGVTHAIIDSLMCMDVHSGDWEAQRLFANALKQTAKNSGIHIHLVAHPRKIVSSEQDPDINDVAGSADIGRLADNIIFVRRAKNEVINPSLHMTPMRISVLKQRHGTGAIGEINGWFHRQIKQFKVEQFDSIPTQYLPREAYETRHPARWKQTASNEVA